MNRRRKPWPCLILLAIACTLAAWIIYIVAAQPRSLLDSATRAAYVGNWYGVSANHPENGAPFCWISDQEILGARDEGTRQRLVRKRLNGTEQALLVTVPTRGYTWLLSPDRKMVQWADVANPQMTVGSALPTDFERVSTLDGHVLVERTTEQRPIWGAQSDSLFYMEHGTWDLLSRTRMDPVLHRLDLAAGRVVGFHLGGMPPLLQNAAPFTTVRPLAQTPDGRILILQCGIPKTPKYSTSYRCALFDLNHPSEPVESWQMDQPQGSIRSDLYPSPDGQRILWVSYDTVTVSSITRFLSRWIPAMRTSPRTRVRLCVSDIHSHGMREIGRYIATDISNRPSYSMRYIMPSWSPDGSKIGFVFNSYLYTLPAK